MFYYGDAAGLNKDERERYRGHEWFDSCERFCRDWDQMAFDPDYPTKPLSYFEPMLRTVFHDQPLTPPSSRHPHNITAPRTIPRNTDRK